MLSRRANWTPETNRLTIAHQERRRRGKEILDLTNSNPTRAGIPYPIDELSAAMSRAARSAYDPAPLGTPSARAAVANEIRCEAADVVITASTSEAYSFLFKLLCDPGDAVVTATPSYPLLQHLAAMELVELHHFALELHKRWEVNTNRLRDAMTTRSKAAVVVNPNNPTGSYVTADEQQAIAACGVAVISDEVFYPFALAAPPAPTFVRDDILTFTLGGLSKSAGLPHYKLGWIRVSGPRAEKQKAIDGLELIADNFLSVATPVQTALPELFSIAPRIRAAIMARVRQNLSALQAAVAAAPSAELLPVEGGWSAVLRLPRIDTDEALALALLEEQGVLVQPGYFFDFQTDGHIVLSLLTDPQTFVEGVRRIIASLPA